MSTSPSPGFSCCVTGSAAFTTHCADLLLDAGHDVSVVVSANSRVSAWAERRGIRRVNDFRTLMAAGPPDFDYLFSVINGVVLSPEVLRLPRKAAINYHNGPLPRYAGVNAASWALLNGETEHGVTWHRMVDRVDEGPVYVQRLFPLVPGATAGEVNDTCRRLGLEALGELAAALATGRATEVPQDLGHRTYYPARRRPASGGLLSWDRDARALVRLVNAHQVGGVVNTFGTARVDLGTGAAVVGAARETGAPSTAPPGTVVAAARDTLRVATATADIELTDVRDQDGGVAELPAPGDVLPPVPASLQAELRARLEDAATHEAYCAREFTVADRTPLPVGAPLPRTAPPPGAPAPAPSAQVSVALPVRADGDGAPGQGGETDPGHRLHRLVLAATLLTVAEHTRRDRVTVDHRSPAGADLPPRLGRFLRAGLPVTVPATGQGGPDTLPAEVWERTGEALRSARGRDVHSRDLTLRRKLPRAGLPVRAGVRAAAPEDGAAQLDVVLDAGRGELRLSSTATREWPAFPEAELCALADRLLHWLRLLRAHAAAPLVRAAPGGATVPGGPAGPDGPAGADRR